MVLGVLSFCLFLSQAAAQCPKVKIINKTDSWTKTDGQNFRQAQRRCKQLFEDSPCLKIFEKYDFQAYRATCGALNQDQKKNEDDL